MFSGHLCRDFIGQPRFSSKGNENWSNRKSLSFWGWKHTIGNKNSEQKIGLCSEKMLKLLKALWCLVNVVLSTCFQPQQICAEQRGYGGDFVTWLLLSKYSILGLDIESALALISLLEVIPDAWKRRTERNNLQNKQIYALLEKIHFSALVLLRAIHKPGLLTNYPTEVWSKQQSRGTEKAKANWIWIKI